MGWAIAVLAFTRGYGQPVVALAFTLKLSDSIKMRLILIWAGHSVHEIENSPTEIRSL